MRVTYYSGRLLLPDNITLALLIVLRFVALFVATYRLFVNIFYLNVIVRYESHI